MYLSQLILNARSRQVQYEHRTLYETHRTLLQAFPDPLPENERVLFRREDIQDTPGFRILVQSVNLPDWSVFDQQTAGYFITLPQIKEYNPVINNNDVLIFRLVANPTVKRDGRRYGLLQEEEQWKWLVRKGRDGGFSCRREDVRIVQQGFIRSKHQKVSLFSVQYDGLLQVKDKKRFTQSLRLGVGTAKGFGFGLLSIAATR